MTQNLHDALLKSDLVVSEDTKHASKVRKVLRLRRVWEVRWVARVERRVTSRGVRRRVTSREVRNKGRIGSLVVERGRRRDSSYERIGKSRSRSRTSGQRILSSVGASAQANVHGKLRETA